MSVEKYTCDLVKLEEALLNGPFEFGDSPLHYNNAPPIPTPSASSEKDLLYGSTSSETKTIWDEAVLGDPKEDQTWVDLSSIDPPWQLISGCEASNHAWDKTLMEFNDDNGSKQLSDSLQYHDKLASSDDQHTGISDLEYTRSTSSALGDVSPALESTSKPRSKTSLDSVTLQDDDFVALYKTELEFQDLISRATDPVGKVSEHLAVFLKISFMLM